MLVHKRKRARAHFIASARVYASCARICARIFMKIWLLVDYYLMSISLKFHKDPSFCWEDIHEIMLNMHVSCIHAFAKFEYTLVHVFASCKRKYAQIFPKQISVAYYSVIN